MLKRRGHGRSSWVAAALTGLCIAAISIGSAQSAAAAGGGVGDQTGGSANDGTIRVSISLTGSATTNGGVTDGGGSGGVVTVSTPPACYWDSLGGAYTGKTMYERLQNSPRDWVVGGEASYLPSVAAVTAHKDDDGIWYTIAAGPNSTVSGNGWDSATTTCMDRLRAGAGPGANNNNSGYYFVATGTQPPAPPPTPPTADQLRDAAFGALTLPQPALAHNPGAATLVNLPTWFWVSGAQFRTWDITATAQLPGLPVYSATVTATPASLSVSSAGGASGPCTPAAGTTAWSPGGSDASACTIEFVRSSLGQPGYAYQVNASMTYATAWTSVIAGTAGPGGALPTQTRVGTADVQVQESQALVTAAR